jgi:uncharacterized membrane protein YvbJ
MPTCQFCGKETAQPDAAYCSYCGSSLRQQPGASVAPPQSQPPQASYAPSGGSSLDASQRYEKALGKIERLGSIIIVLSIVTLILVIV